MDANQGTPGGDPAAPVSPSTLPDAQAVEAERAATEARHLEEEARERAALARAVAADHLGGSVHAGLLRWFVFAVVGSIAAIVLHHPDAAALFAMAAVYALVQSW